MRSVYIHIPFCTHICNYCDFPKFFYNKPWVDDYLKVLEKEIKEDYQGDTIKTIYIGGGTPTSLNLTQLKILLEITKIFKVDNLEFCVEGNVENIDEDKLKLLKEYGVNRISLGVQTFNDEFLSFLGRAHTKKLAIEKIKLTKKYFDNINIDLMYAFENQTIKDLEEDLDIFLNLDLTHLSTYSLIIEPHTKFSDKKYIEQDIDADMYELIKDKLNKYNHYETSNFSKVGFESIHNLTYWNNEEYYGFGIGAAGFIDNKRYNNTKGYNNYMQGQIISESHELSELENMQNEMILGLRKRSGVNKLTFKNKYNKSIDKVFDITDLLKQKKLKENEEYIYIADEYTYRSNEILVNFI
jgi:oxygen-independent coproporphyrinogen-3 oxidase